MIAQTTSRRSKPTFPFVTAPKTPDGQYARKEMERIVNFILNLIPETVVNNSTFDVQTLNQQLTNIRDVIALLQRSIPIISTSTILSKDDLLPIIVSNQFSRTITVPLGNTAIFFDGVENNGDITNEGTILVL
jgi:hypothetical protein